MSFVFVSDYDRMSAYCITVKGKNGEIGMLKEVLARI